MKYNYRKKGEKIVIWAVSPENNVINYITLAKEEWDFLRKTTVALGIKWNWLD